MKHVAVPVDMLLPVLQKVRALCLLDQLEAAALHEVWVLDLDGAPAASSVSRVYVETMQALLAGKLLSQPAVVPVQGVVL